MIQFKLLNQDNKTNEMFIQGSRANDTSNDIAALVFQNYDKDSSRIYNMASIAMKDQFGLPDKDGFGTMVFKTNPDGSNLKEQMRLKPNGSLLINTLDEKALLTVEGSLYSLSYCNMGSMYIGSNLTVGGNANINSNLYVDKNVTISNTLSNLGNAYFASNVYINSNLFVDQNVTISNTLSNLGNAFFASNVDVNSNLNVFNNFSACNATLCNLNLALLQMSGNALLNQNLIVMTFRASNTVPSPSNSNLNLFVDEYGRLSAVTGCNFVKVYNSMSNLGDLLTHTGCNDYVVPRGSNNQFLTCDSNLPGGIGWKNLSTDTVIFDETESKYFHAYSSTTTNLSTTSNTDLIMDVVRTRSVDYFTLSNNTNLFITGPGLFYISAKITTEASAGNSISGTYASLYFSSNGGSNFAELSNTRAYQLAPSTTTPGSSSAFMTLLTMDANSVIKTVGFQYAGTNTTRTRQNSCEWIVERQRIDGGNDNSKYADYITESNLALSGSFQDVPFFKTNYQDNSTYTNSNGLFTVLENGIYVIQGKVNTSSTVARASVVSKLLQTNSSNIFVDVPGTLFYNYMDQNTVGNATGNFYTLLNLTANTQLKIQSSILSGASATLLGASEIVLRKFQSTISGQSFLDFYSGYSTSNITLGAAYTDVTISACNYKDSTNFTISNAEITVLETGRYFISSQVSIINTSGAANTVSTAGARMLINTGNGFSEVSGTTGLAHLSYSNAGYGTIPLKTTQILQEGAKVKLQANRVAGTGALVSASNATGITMFKLDELSSIENLLLKFGTYYKYAASLGTTTTSSTTYIEKLRMTTVSVPEGVYRVGIAFQIADIAVNKDLNIQVQVDDSVTIHDSRVNLTVNATPIQSDFAQVTLTEGIHNVALNFKANSGTVGLLNVKLEFWRVE